MESKLKSLQQDVLEKIKRVDNPSTLESLWLSVFATSGSFTTLSKEIKTVSNEEKPKIGKLINSVKKELEKAFTDKKKSLIVFYSSPWFDVTIPGEKPALGHLHPQTHVLYELLDIFKSLGFQAADGPEIETDWYNFGSLNFPNDHPARDTQQSLHIDTKGSTNPGEILLRTQTSAMQVRVMEGTPPPIRVIVPGKAFRYEAVDASHGFEFWQLEGFAVDRNITLSDLFGTITTVLKKIMGEKTKLRFACTNFPFVEPGVDTYMQCTVCKGMGCSFCKNSGWSEIMPAGMIHPNVLKSAKIDPKMWRGFAFAIGLSRLVTLKYGMDDLRLLTMPDLRILNQF
ncbi:phenylalanine--tRNA ligase subunit alpha [Candidatus Gottesmanbacteria bacterium RIFCSPHIGHO2_02_FULL_39_11]|uniref:Phenylalanine--tRNA ligase alpha subunit n=1 Tax=Candidatus Gottesmanbacteria bacterium RIFCSPHIGHO2_02_FULL_39_11 TaxID=1798382 RepID=A0A1F5ZV83_9BACT|nr:MAG: phenylalanine--tRNA ligase subunit alpha [Candidatus Gottesmanbacteria bacterium RIFCSPHIGHO2_02_FULL_39_11]